MEGPVQKAFLFISFDSWNKLVRTGPHGAQAMFQLETQEKERERKRRKREDRMKGEREKERVRSMNRPLKGAQAFNRWS